MTLTVAAETPLTDEMRALVAQLTEELLALTPREFCHHLTVEQMAGPDTTVFVVRDGGAAVGCGALKRHAGGIGEVKRMFALRACRGRGIGRLVLNEIVALAEREGLRELVLETGNNFDAAMGLYASAGFAPCGPVLDYPASPYTAFYRKPLNAAVRA
jgi:putative acetyltransferase